MSDGETANLVLKRMLELFLKVPPLKKLEFQKQKKTMKFVQKENFELKSNEWLKTYKMNFINKKTNKEKVINFVLTLGRSWRAKKAQNFLQSTWIS